MMGVLSRSGRLRLAFLVGLPLVVAGCGDDPAEPAYDRFVGSWAARAFELRPVSSVQYIDLVGYGLEMIMEVDADARFVITLTIPGNDPGIDRGTLEVERGGEHLTLTFDEGLDDPLTGSFSFSEDGQLLTIVLPDARFDFDGDGEASPAEARIVLERM